MTGLPGGPEVAGVVEIQRGKTDPETGDGDLPLPLVFRQLEELPEGGGLHVVGGLVRVALGATREDLAVVIAEDREEDHAAEQLGVGVDQLPVRGEIASVALLFAVPEPTHIVAGRQHHLRLVCQQPGKRADA